MSADEYLLDISAVSAFLEDESGADRVEETLRRRGASIAFPALMETDCVVLAWEKPGVSSACSSACSGIQ